jgi:hypothetical protein
LRHQQAWKKENQQYYQAPGGKKVLERIPLKSGGLTELFAFWTVFNQSIIIKG